jgi:hypothetical protein
VLCPRILGWSCGDFLGFIALRIGKALGRKRLVFEKHIANCNTLFECYNTGFVERNHFFGDDYIPLDLFSSLTGAKQIFELFSHFCCHFFVSNNLRQVGVRKIVPVKNQLCF